MNMRWDLSPLYKSFKSKEFEQDKNTLENLVSEILNWCGEELLNSESPEKKIAKYISYMTEFNNLAIRLYNFCELTLSVEAKNSVAQKEVEKLERLFTELNSAEVAFQKWIGALHNLEEIISKDELLKEHSFFINEIAGKNKYLLSEEEERVIARMKNTGSAAWSKLQNLITSTLLVDIVVDGEEKKLPLPVVRNMAHHKDGEVRKAAYEAELKAYKKIEESSAACLNGIKGEVLTLSEMRGYSSPLEETLINSRMDRESLEAMLTAIKESLPAFNRYFRKKAELLGYEGGLPFYEMFAPVGGAEMSFTYEEARDFIVENFNSFSKRLSDYATTAFEEGWIDAETREGKRGGAFCSNLIPIKQSRIMSNFTGSFSDVATLAHELGHGYHGACLNDERLLNTNYPMPIAETASIFCETIVKNAALKKAGGAEALTILENDISDEAQVIVDIYSRFLFESAIFERRKESALSSEEFKELMMEAQIKAYGSALDEELLHPYMWVNKPHYYYAEANFYNFPYAFGLLFAKGLYAEYLKRGEKFIGDYDKLLSVTGKMKIADITKLMGVDIHDVNFWRSSLKLIEEQIDRFIELA